MPTAALTLVLLCFSLIRASRARRCSSACSSARCLASALRSFAPAAFALRSCCCADSFVLVGVLLGAAAASAVPLPGVLLGLVALPVALFAGVLAAGTAPLVGVRALDAMAASADPLPALGGVFGGTDRTTVPPRGALRLFATRAPLLAGVAAASAPLLAGVAAASAPLSAGLSAASATSAAGAAATATAAEAAAVAAAAREIAARDADASDGAASVSRRCRATSLAINLRRLHRRLCARCRLRAASISLSEAAASGAMSAGGASRAPPPPANPTNSCDDGSERHTALEVDGGDAGTSSMAGMSATTAALWP